MERFIGSWLLRSCEHRLDNGTSLYPMGKTVQGLILYTADGYMSASLMDPKRPKFRSQDLYGGTESERLQAVGGYVQYAGRYEVRDDFVLHHVDVSLFPNWVGTYQQRYFRFFDRSLELRTNPFSVDGQRQVACLLWERAPAAPPA